MMDKSATSDKVRTQKPLIKYSDQPSWQDPQNEPKPTDSQRKFNGALKQIRTLRISDKRINAT